MRKVNNKTPIVCYTTILLLCLVLITSSMASGLLARYKTTAESGDSARVAQFSVTADISNGKSLNITTFDNNDMSQSKETKFTVTSNSEVAVKYNVIIDLGVTAKPAWLDEVTIDGESASTQGEDGNYRFVFENVGTFPAGQDKTNEHILKFNAKEGLYSEDQTLNISISVVAEQID